MFGLCFLSLLISISYGTCADASNDVTSTLNNFALEFHRKLAAKADWDQNVAMSAMSVFTAFSALIPGTGGDTKLEMQNALNIKSGKSLGDWYKKHMRTQDDFVLANKLFVADNFELLSTYVQSVQNVFDMAIESINCSDPDAAEKKMNDWIDDTTNGLIKEMFPPGSVDAMTRMVLANAIYFKGAWKQQFDKANNQEDFFEINEVDGEFVTYMTQEKQFMYGWTDDADFLELSYAGDKLSMLFVLPYEQTADDLETKMTAEMVTEMRSKLQKQMVNIWIPKFKIEFESSLDGDLMDMPSLFDANKADLSGLSKENGLYVSKASHKTFLEIDEEGTKAAGFTGLFIQSRSFSTQFKLEKPFLFYILHKSSGAIIFSGKVMKPDESM